MFTSGFLYQAPTSGFGSQDFYLMISTLRFLPFFYRGSFIAGFLISGILPTFHSGCQPLGFPPMDLYLRISPSGFLPQDFDLRICISRLLAQFPHQDLYLRAPTSGSLPRDFYLGISTSSFRRQGFYLSISTSGLLPLNFYYKTSI